MTNADSNNSKEYEQAYALLKNDKKKKNKNYRSKKKNKNYRSKKKKNKNYRSKNQLIVLVQKKLLDHLKPLIKLNWENLMIISLGQQWHTLRKK